MAAREVTYEYYCESYGGTLIEEADWPRLMQRAAQRLVRLKTLSEVTCLGDEDECESMAICAMAETYQAQDATLAAASGVSSEAIGSVRVTYGDGSKAMPRGVDQAILEGIRPWLHVCLVVA